MFSTRSKDKYKIIVEYARPGEEVESPEVTAQQAAFIKKLIDEVYVPLSLTNLVLDTPIELDTLRDCVRYAQDKCASVLIAVAELDAECARLGMREEHGAKRFDFYRYIIENKGGALPFPRAQHIGDEDWLYTASVNDLLEEIVMSVNERYYMVGTWHNMDKFIKVHKGYMMRKAKGLGYVYKKPEPKPEPEPEPDAMSEGTSESGSESTLKATSESGSEGTLKATSEGTSETTSEGTLVGTSESKSVPKGDKKALVKLTGSLKASRLGRAWRGGRGGGSVGRAAGSSFRGWK